ncbi:PREDICTED: laccase-1-like [Ceratosolen solmsi marchali]|uniref:Laccase-1-like n=1 Tax=Ceratosolen solmsi marchali TaxID=326594 RepID=A0AAJ6YLX0_9HYME|nr:PREDICTED: laccase-1-like [Ceratosolen solmsi marchali]
MYCIDVDYERKRHKDAEFAATESLITVYKEKPFWGYKKSEELVPQVDLSQHPCRRSCKDNEPPAKCSYTFYVEQYYTMSKACYDCPTNITDCFRPHCIPADGIDRPLVVVNRQMPGPSIEVCEDDEVIVKVINMMHGDSTTLHWHGLHMRRTPYMDGTPYISQCPIPPGNKFQYNFVAKPHGTHFWHSHVGFQRGDGMFGPLIVRRAPKRNPLHNLYDYDEHNIIVSDWDHELGLEKFLAHYHGSGDNKPPSILINGMGRFETMVQDDENSKFMLPVATFVVKQDFKYRFRIINAEFLNCPIQISIDNHNLWIVSSDGKDVEPLEVKSVVTYAGERFDIIVEMNQAVNNYWMRFKGLMDCGANFTSAHQVAILRYEGAPDNDPDEHVSYNFPDSEALVPEINPLNKGTETKDILSILSLEALDKNDQVNTMDPDYQFFVSYDFYMIDNYEFHRKHLYGYQQVKQKVGTPQLNHISMKLPSFPLMSQRDLINSARFCNESTVEGCDKTYCRCTHVLQVKLNSIVEVVLIDEGLPYDANHPFHLHGHDFRVVAMERMARNVSLEAVRTADRQGHIVRKFDRAPIKDTVTVPDGGYTIIRFLADNPGYWLFHCHIEFHSEVGMALIFKVGEHEDFEPVPPQFPRCGNYQPVDTTRNVAHPSTTTQSTQYHTNDNEINYMDEQVRTSIANWLPLILSELRATSGSSSLRLPEAAITACLGFLFARELIPLAF